MFVCGVVMLYLRFFPIALQNTVMYKPIHVLSRKSTRQHRNVFIWCTESSKLALGWCVDNESLVTVSTAYRWITDAVLRQARSHTWDEAERYTLFPVEVRPSMVLTYSVHKNGAGLSRESQDIIAPGDYGLYTIGDPGLYFFFSPVHSFSSMGEVVKENSPLLFARASLTPSIIRQALDRDRQCIFSGDVPSCDSESDPLVTTWVFPPFLGHKLSEDQALESKYYIDPDTCDLSELMVAENVVTGRKEIVALFWENKLGVDVDDNYRIIVFEGSERLHNTAPLKSHLTLVDGPYRLSDRFLRLHFTECLVVSAGRGDVMEDYKDQEIGCFMEELGVYDGEMESSDPRWSTPLGSHVHDYLLRQKMTECDTA